jgi:GH24 family phage-related lysozyme (muramidase)
MSQNMSKTQYGNKRAEDMTINRYKSIIREAEGLRFDAYKPDPKEKHYTIGYGHYGSDVSPDAVITKEEAEILLDKDVRVRAKNILSLLPKFHSFPEPLKDAIFSEHFRGSIQGSPETRRLINEGKYLQASEEFLDNNEYRRAKTDPNIRGIRKRMEKVSTELKKLAK